MIKRRYPGMHQFEPEQQNIFFGREQEIKDVVNLVQLEKIAVLHGGSGLGKSSLLKAGVMPALRQLSESRRYAPLYVRFGVSQKNDTSNDFREEESDSTSPLQIVCERLEECIEKDPLFLPNPELGFLLGESDPPRLWHLFKHLQTEHKKRFVLIFDQFEEFVTYQPAQQVALLEQLAEAVFSEMPQSLFDRFHTFDDTQQHLLSVPVDVRVLFTIRTDRLGIFESLKTQFQSILDKRYELKGLRWKQAEQAIQRPAALSELNGEPFASISFEFKQPALDKIHTFFVPEDASDDLQIEAFQLQLICSRIEDDVIEGIVKDIDGNQIPDVTADDLPDLENIIRSYYHRTLDKLSDNEREAASIALEYGLVFKGERPEDCKRLSVDVAQLLKEYGRIGLTAELLEKLEDDRLLRREALRKDRYHIEISHDTLLAPILESRAVREEDELLKKQAEERRQHEIARERRLKELEEERQRQEQQLREREEQLAKEKRLVRRANLFTLLSAALCILLIVFGSYNYWDTRREHWDAGEQYLFQHEFGSAKTAFKAARNMLFFDKDTLDLRINAADTLSDARAKFDALSNYGDSLFFRDEFISALYSYRQADTALRDFEVKKSLLLRWSAKSDKADEVNLRQRIRQTQTLLREQFGTFLKKGVAMLNESGGYGCKYACENFAKSRDIHRALERDNLLIQWEEEYRRFKEQLKTLKCPCSSE